MTEAQFMAQVRQLARVCHWQCYHTNRSDRSDPGFPDLVMVRGNRLIFAELKTAKGKLSLPQKEWLASLKRVPDIEVYLWRPDDWDPIVEVLR